MDDILKKAINNPKVVLLSGSKPVENRNSLKKANGLLRFGAGVMLGIACLSPIQHVMAAPSTYDTQTTHIVQEQEVQEQTNTNEEVTVNEENLTEIQKRDLMWERKHEEARIYRELQKREDRLDRTIPGDNPHGVKFLQRLWNRKTGDPANIPSDYPYIENVFVKFHPASQFRADPSSPRAKDTGWTNRYHPYRGLRRQMDVAPDLAKAWSMKMHPYTGMLLNQGYLEIKTGHGPENPSQRFVDICQELVEINNKTEYRQHATAAGDMVFDSCLTKEMKPILREDKIKDAVSDVHKFVETYWHSGVFLSIVGAAIPVIYKAEVEENARLDAEWERQMRLEEEKELGKNNNNDIDIDLKNIENLKLDVNKILERRAQLADRSNNEDNHIDWEGQEYEENRNNRKNSSQDGSFKI